MGRLFIEIGRALIDVQKGGFKIRVQEEEVAFNVFKAMKYLITSDSCFRLDRIEAIVLMSIFYT